MNEDGNFEDTFLTTGSYDPDLDFSVLFHGHLDLEDIQRYIESKEQKPVRKVTKYVNIWCDRFGTICCSMYRDKINAEDAANSDIKYKYIAHPIEVTE